MSEGDYRVLKTQVEVYLGEIKNIEEKLKSYNSTANLSTLSKMKKSNYKNSTDYEVALNNYNNQKESLIKDLQIKELEKLYKKGYWLIMNIRKKIKGEVIRYVIANEKSKIIYEVSEEQLLADLSPININEVIESIQKGTLNFSMNYSSSFKKAQGQLEDTEIIQELPDGQGSTLWSKGYRVYQEVKNYIKQNPDEAKEFGLTVNFGHFFETYYYLGGNKKNRNVKNFNSLEFYAYMRVLMNSTKFYQGGDYRNFQLKSNSATLTSFSTIRRGLQEILKILDENSTPAKKEKALKKFFSHKPQTRKMIQERVDDFIKGLDSATSLKGFMSALQALDKK